MENEIIQKIANSIKDDLSASQIMGQIGANFTSIDGRLNDLVLVAMSFRDAPLVKRLKTIENRYLDNEGDLAKDLDNLTVKDA